MLGILLNTANVKYDDVNISFFNQLHISTVLVNFIVLFSFHTYYHCPLINAFISYITLAPEHKVNIN